MRRCSPKQVDCETIPEPQLCKKDLFSAYVLDVKDQLTKSCL